MRIDRIRLAGFGRLRCFELEPGPGLTCVLGPNESGKSTLIAAITALLYDFQRGNQQRDREACDRARPWSGDQYSGELVITSRDWSYQVVRNFATGHTSVFRLPGESDVTAEFRKAHIVDVGSRLFGLDRSLFLALAVIRQRELLLTGDVPRRLVSLIEGLVEAPGGVATAQQAREQLNVWLRTAVNPNAHAEANSPLLRAQTKVSELRARLQAARGALEALEPLAVRERHLATALETGAAAVRDLEQELAAARALVLNDRLSRIDVAIRTAETTRQELIGIGPLPTAEALAAAEQAVHAQVAQSNAAATAMAGRAARLSECRRELEALAGSLAGIDDSTIAQLAAVEAAVATAPTAEPRSSSPALVPLIVALVVAAIGYAVAGLAGGIIGAIIGAAVGYLLGARGGTESTRVGQEDRDLLGAWLERIGVTSVQGIRDLITRRDFVQADLNRLLVEERQSDAECQARRDAAAIVLDSIGIAARGAAALEQLQSIRHCADRARDLDQRARAADELLAALRGSDTDDSLRRRLAELESEAGVLSREPVRPVPDVEAALAQARACRDAAYTEHASTRAMLDQRERAIASPADLEVTLAVATADLARLEHLNDVLVSAGKRIEAASLALRSEVVPALSSKLGRSFGAATGGRYRAVKLEPTTLAVTVEGHERADPVDLGMLSQGTQDALLALLRVSILDLMAESTDPVPLLLDDPLSSVDCVRASLIVDLLASLAEDRQIILLTQDARLADRVSARGSTVLTLPPPDTSPQP